MITIGYIIAGVYYTGFLMVLTYVVIKLVHIYRTQYHIDKRGKIIHHDNKSRHTET